MATKEHEPGGALARVLRAGPVVELAVSAGAIVVATFSGLAQRALERAMGTSTPTFAGGQSPTLSNYTGATQFAASLFTALTDGSMLLITPLVCLAVYFVASKSSRQALACTKVVVATACCAYGAILLAIVWLLHRYRAPGLIVDLATALQPTSSFLLGHGWALDQQTNLARELYRALHGFNFENMRAPQDSLSLLMSCSNYYSTLVIITAASTAALICFSALASELHQRSDIGRGLTRFAVGLTIAGSIFQSVQWVLLVQSFGQLDASARVLTDVAKKGAPSERDRWPFAEPSIEQYKGDQLVVKNFWPVPTGASNRLQLHVVCDYQTESGGNAHGQNRLHPIPLDIGGYHQTANELRIRLTGSQLRESCGLAPTVRLDAINVSHDGLHWSGHLAIE